MTVKQDMSDNPWLVLLGGVSKVQGKACIEQAHGSGMKVALIDTPDNLQTFAHCHLADEILPVESCDFSSVQPVCDRLHNIVRFYSFKENLQFLTSSLNALAGIPWTSPSTIKTIQNKYHCRKLLKDNGIAQPECHLCHSKEQLLHTLRHLKASKYIIKPVGRAGSEGVEVYDPATDKPADLENHNEYFPYLVETFVEGNEYSIEAIVCEGACHCLGITKKLLFSGTFFEQGHVIPANEEFTEAQVDSIYRQLKHICRITGISHGMVHAEFWSNNSEITWGEIHNRPGGDFISYMIAQISGIKIYASQFQNQLVYDKGPAPPYMAVWSHELTDSKLEFEDNDKFRFAYLSHRNMFCTSGTSMKEALENARQTAISKSAV